MVIAEVFSKNSSQMPLIQNDHLIQTVAADGADYSFDIGVLPRRSGRRDNFLYPQTLDPPTNPFSVGVIAIA